MAELLAEKYPAAKGEPPKKELSFSQKLAEASTVHSKAVRANEHCIGIVADLKTKLAKVQENLAQAAEKKLTAYKAHQTLLVENGQPPAANLAALLFHREDADIERQYAAAGFTFPTAEAKQE